MNFLSKINGYKTYIVCAVTVAYAVVSYWDGGMTQNAAMAMIFGASGLGALRHGVANS